MRSTQRDRPSVRIGERDSSQEVRVVYRTMVHSVSYTSPIPARRALVFPIHHGKCTTSAMPSKSRSRPGVPLKRLRRVLKIADVHVPGGSDGGHAAPGRLIGAPHIEQEGGGGARYCLGMRDHELAVNVPVDMSGCPDNFEVVAIFMLKSGDLGVLEIGDSLPVGAVHSVGLVSYLLHIDFS